MEAVEAPDERGVCIEEAKGAGTAVEAVEADEAAVEGDEAAVEADEAAVEGAVGAGTAAAV